MGCNEMDPRPAVHTIYNTLLFIGNHGEVLGRRRKMMPTFVERAVWGCGDGSDLQPVETDYGRIGGLICGENLMTLARAHLIAQGEDFHVAVFPGAFALHTGPKLEEFDATAESFWGYSSCRAHAFEAGAFVLGSCGYITDADFPSDFALRDSLNIDYAKGGSAVYAPIGIPLAPPTPGDTIVYAVCPAQFVKIAKAVIDTVGHYARPDLFTLSVHARPHQQVARRAVESAPTGELRRIADRHEVGVSESRLRSARRRRRSVAGGGRRCDRVASEKCRQRLGHAARVLHVQQMRRPRSTKPSAFGNQSSISRWRSLQIGDTRDSSRRSRRAPAARCGPPRSRSKRHCCNAGNSCAKKVSASATPAFERAGQHALQRRAVRRPRHHAHEGVDGAGLVAGAERLADRRHRGLARGQHPCAARPDGQGRLEQRERLHLLRGVEGELQRDVRARRMANQMRALDAEMSHQRTHMRGLTRDAHGTGHAAAARVADAMKAHHAIAAASAGSSSKGGNQSANSPACTSTTGSPAPRTMYRSSTSGSTATRCIMARPAPSAVCAQRDRRQAEHSEQALRARSKPSADSNRTHVRPPTPATLAGEAIAAQAAGRVMRPAPQAARIDPGPSP